MKKITDKQRDELIALAWQASKASYSPYSKFKVGAALISKSGKIYTGCNVENASYGLTNCAERTAIFKMVSEGEACFTALAVVAGETAQGSSPCGACRQVMAEFCESADTPIFLAGKDNSIIESSVGGLLPYAFLKGNLIDE